MYYNLGQMMELEIISNMVDVFSAVGFLILY